MNIKDVHEIKARGFDNVYFKRFDYGTMYCLFSNMVYNPADTIVLTRDIHGEHIVLISNPKYADSQYHEKGCLECEYKWLCDVIERLR